MPEGNKLAAFTIGSREHFEFSRLLVNTIQEYAIFLLDTNGYVASWNPGARSLKGYEPDEIIGKHFSVFYPQKDIDTGKPTWELEEAAKQGHVEDEGWRIKKDGSRFWANVVITALRDDSGEMVGYAKVTRDLSERKRNEEDLYQANLKLKRQSAELKELNRTKDEFISLASHQLRTPASGVKQFLGLLLEGYAGELSDTQKEFLQRAYEGNERQIDLIDDLLRIAQVDAGRIILKRHVVAIGELIEDILREQQDVFKRRQQTVTFQMPSQQITALVDETKFRMVLENIIDNASKYTPEKGTIAVSLVAPNSVVGISIADTGVGMDEVSIKKLFKKFSRVPNYLSESVGGSGLGLYWAYKIVQLHKGIIEVKSQPDTGTTFMITIPKGAKHA